MKILRAWRQVRRRWTFFLLDCDEFIEELKRDWRQYACNHSFRPIRLYDQPGRICSTCRKTETLSPEQFFAEFGERGWRK